MSQASYPVRFSVDYPDRDLNRVTTAFRLFVSIPILIVLSAVSGAAGVGGQLFFGLLLMHPVPQKYPRWWFDWNLQLQRFSNRVGAYLALMDDGWNPYTTDYQSAHLDYVSERRKHLDRWMPLYKWFLAIPQYFVVAGLFIGGGGIIASSPSCSRGVPKGPLRFRGRCDQVAKPRNGLRISLVTDRVPTFQPRRLTHRDWNLR